MSYVTHSFHFIFLMLLLLLPIFAVAQNYRNVTLGSSLTANISNNASWPSPSGEFAFGFRKVEDNRFLLAIWLDKIPDKTIVWYAYVNGNTSSVPGGSKVELTTDGTLVLKDPQGTVLWNPQQVTGEVSYAAMLDTGNFVLASGNSEAYSWESFKQPTDTILPSQIMRVRTLNNQLYSRQTKTTYSKGRFRLRFLDEGNLVLNPVPIPSKNDNNYDSYYNLTGLRGNFTHGRELVFDKSGSIYIVTKDETIVNLTWPNRVLTSDLYYRATLDFDGVFAQYSHPRTFNASQLPRWSIVRSIPENICTSIVGRLGTGACGYNSYCMLVPPSPKPICECPPGYVFLDPNNRYGGCRPNFILQGCQEEDSRNPEDLFELKTLKNVDWPTSDYESLDSYNEQDCRTSCFNDCQCAVALQRQDGKCWKKKLPLPNGRLEPSVNGIAFIKVRKVQGFSIQPNYSYPPSLCPKNKDRSTLILVGSLLGSSVFFNFLFLVAIFLVFLCMDKKLRENNNHQSAILRSNLRSFTYKELEEATGGFKEELGRGAFGIVYKGVTEEMGLRNYVAVKKLDKVFREGEKEFKTEVNVIGQTHHKNLVRLLGFCEEGQNRLLVYEFMSNSSLAEHLFGISKPDWNQRIQIAFGISRGLMYLHEECSTQIIHCDIKPQNILLDDSFAARISDFGLAKLLMTDQTRTSTGIRGTKGYVAPEWFRNTSVTVKVDIYSFGVMLLEIICCRKSVELELGEQVKAVLTDWAYDCYTKGKLQDLVMNDEDARNDMRRVERLVMIAIWCIQEDPSLRPSMKKVTQMLEGVLEVSVPPCPYSFTFMGDSSETSQDL